MKKLYIALALVLQVFAVRATPSDGDSSWLYWTLDLQDTWGNNVWWWEKPVGVADGTYAVWMVAENTTTGDKVNYYSNDEIKLSNNGTQGSMNDGIASQVELQLADLSAYSFYSAIGTVEGDVYTAAWTSHVRDYESLKGVIQSGTMSSADVWNTAVVPEPTSGFLLLLGVAGLALKRKRQIA